MTTAHGKKSKHKKELTAEQIGDILNLFLEKNNDAGVDTIEEYLLKILQRLWNEGEGFSGKRPFGNSGWESELIFPLIRSGVIKGTIDTDDDGYIQDYNYDYDEADSLISMLLKNVRIVPDDKSNDS